MQADKEEQKIPSSLFQSKVNNIYESTQKAHRALQTFAIATGDLVNAIWDIPITDKVNKSISLYSRDKSFDLDKALDALNRASWVSAIRELDLNRTRKERLIKIYSDQDRQIPCFWFEGPECLERLQSDDGHLAEIEETIKKRLLNPADKSGKSAAKILTDVQEKTRFSLFHHNPCVHGITYQDEFEWLENLERLLHYKKGTTNEQAFLADVVIERGNKAPMIVEREAFSFQIFKNGNVEVRIKPSYLAALNGRKQDPVQIELHRMLMEEMPADLANLLTFEGEQNDGLRYSFRLEEKEGCVISCAKFAGVRIGEEAGVVSRGTAADRFRGICDSLRPSTPEAVESIPENITRNESTIVTIMPGRNMKEQGQLLQEFLAGMPATPILNKSTLNSRVKEIEHLSSGLMNSLLAGEFDEEAAGLLVTLTRSLGPDIEAKRTASNEEAIRCALIECQSIEALGEAIEDIVIALKAD